MKKDIHPKYFEEATVTCACGNKFKVGSTDETIKVEICSACHPFYTGKQKLVDTARRVDKFKKKVEASKEIGKTVKKTEKKANQKAKQASKKVKVAVDKE